MYLAAELDRQRTAYLSGRLLHSPSRVAVGLYMHVGFEIRPAIIFFSPLV